MKKIKDKTVFFIMIPVSFLYLFCMGSPDLIKQRERTNDYTLNREWTEKIRKETSGLTQVQIMKYSIELTASYLQFSRYNNIDSHKANCVGYAKLCASICNCALHENNLTGYAKPVVGYVSFNRINLCALLTFCLPDKWKPFVKDHDFVEFYFGDGIIYADPCLYDLIKSDCMTFRS